MTDHVILPVFIETVGTFMKSTPSFPVLFAAVVLACSLPGLTCWSQEPAVDDPAPVSYVSQIRPILAASCFGCHQGARDSGEYDMTAFDSFLAGGHSGVEAIVPNVPGDSHLIELVSSEDGDPQMPPADSNSQPLTEQNVQLIRMWIEQGAHNDSTETKTNWSVENPPTYTRQPNVTAIDYSSDGKWLAINGFHEVLLFDTQDLSDGQSAKRLIGLSARIESLEFSPDGKLLAVSGGNPAEFGEVQIWDIKTGELQLSRIVSHDTVYGISWSPDGTRVAFGCTDTTVRAIDVRSGEQVLYQGAHDDWIRDTVFSADGSLLVSVGRDMTCKLIEVSTQRFIDNITSITPGVLKGGIASVARNPVRDEIVIGGADGIPKIYRMNRITKRVIGDDANLMRLFPRMPGRIQSIAISNDGKRIAAVSSLDGKGAVHVYSCEFDPTVSDELKAILSKQPSQWNTQERNKIESWNKADVHQIAQVPVDECGLYAVEFHPDGKQFATAGADGIVRVFETETGQLVNAFQPVTTSSRVNVNQVVDWRFKGQAATGYPDPQAVKISGLTISPGNIEFQLPTDYVQLVIQAINEDDGTVFDVSHVVTIQTRDEVVSVDGSLVQPVANGTTELLVEYGGQTIVIPVQVKLPDSFLPEFTRDVDPILTRLGCNGGTCHGSADGKMGFKLSLRGYDPVFDIRAFTDDMGARRTNLAAPSDSLMLAKPASDVPHQGGKLFSSEDKYYKLIREWIRGGAKFDLDAPHVIGVELFPKNPVLNVKGDFQQMRLVATWSDGSQRDVTREAVIEVGGMETAQIQDDSLVKALRRGETPILGRYKGAFTATTLTVMGDRQGYTWHSPELWSDVDKLVANKWQRMKIQPSGLCSDDEFIRRIYLDLTGLPPAVNDVLKFVADARPTRVKRDEMVDDLIGNPAFVEHWSNKWADLLQVNRKYLGPQGARAFREWLREQIRENRPYDQLAYEILTATGSNRENPAASYFKIHRTPVDAMENTTHLFLATRFNCNKCHDHPFERWTQDQYFETAAWFAQVSLKRDPASGDQNIAGTAVEGAKPLYEIVSDENDGEVTHDRTGAQVEPAFPFDCDFQVNPNASRRAQLASWITSPDNPYFATSYVNRLWGYMLGIGLIEPLDDIRAGNPPTNPELLELLRAEFVESGFDVQHVLRLICKSRTYQLSIKSNSFNADDHVNYSHALARRLPAEVLFDSIHFVTGSALKIPGVKPGTRAAELPDSGARLPSGFLSTLGRPARESACECERSNDLQLSSVLALVSGPDVARAIADPESELSRLVAREPDNRKLINEIYLRIISRPATDTEIQLTIETLKSLADDHAGLIAQRDELQNQVTARLPELEKLRLANIQKTATDLDNAIKQLDPDLIQKEKSRETAISETRTKLDAYVASPQGLTAWFNEQQTSVHWHPLAVSGLTATIDQPWSVLEDRSVLLQPGSDKNIFTFTSQTDLTGVSTVRLELLPHDSLKAKGPGLAKNGNLVLTEFEIEAARPDQPDQWQKIEFASALASFEQPGFPVAMSFDGKTDNQAGWAIGANTGKTSWATFQLKTPLGFSGGTLLRIRFHHQFGESHQIGRFRLSLSRSHAVGLGLSEELLRDVAKPEDKRSKETQERLTSAFRRSDAEFAELEKVRNLANKPLAIDPEIIRLRKKLDRVSQPVPVDSVLVQLINDSLVSEKQMANSRLTAAQDLTWALINSPSFLFNR